MFYGGKASDSPGGGRNAASIRPRIERYDQMTKQQQLIEQKKKEIEAKMAADKERKEMEIMMLQQQQKLQQQQASALGQSSSMSSTNSSASSSRSKESSVTEAKQNVFANDGSFMNQFRKLQEQQQKEKEQVKIKQEQEAASAIKKPMFKILNTSTVNKGVSNNQQGSSGIGSNNRNFERDQPNRIYNAAPPPPPPPPPVQDRKPQHQQDFTTGRGNGAYQNVPPPPPPPAPVLQIPIVQQWQPPPQVKAFAIAVADGGDIVEERARKTKSDDPLMWFLYRPDSKEYQSYRDLVIQIRNEKSFCPNPPPIVPPPVRDYFPAPSSYGPSMDKDMRLKRSNSGNSSEDEDNDGSAKRRSRWGPQSSAAIQPPTLTAPLVRPGNLPPQMPQRGIMVSGVPPPPMQVGFPNVGIKQESFSGTPPPSLFPPGTLSQTPIGNFPVGIGMGFQPRGPAPLLSRVTPTNPQLLSYARQSYGTIDLDEEQWKQCEEAFKMNLLFQDIARKKARDEQLAQSGKFKHEYDSDEEVDDVGTWEHKQRLKEMEKTKVWATELTSQAKGKHHIGDFLPPEELNKFMEKYKAVREGRQMDESAYQDFKIAQDNVGFKLLQKMGWTDGQGLGSAGQGITAPIDKGSAVSDKQGLGVEKPDDINEDDDEYAAYRKRMMLAYRFRPNPLNNPRRAYY